MIIVLTEPQKNKIIENLIIKNSKIEYGELEDKIYEELDRINPFYKDGNLQIEDLDYIKQKLINLDILNINEIPLF